MRCLCAECPFRPPEEIAQLKAKREKGLANATDDLKDEIPDSDNEDEDAADNDAEGEEAEPEQPEEEIIVDSSAGGKRDHIRELWTGRSNNLLIVEPAPDA